MNKSNSLSPQPSLEDFVAEARGRSEPDFSQGIKYDGNKVQMELLPLRELREVARVLTYGAKKYDPDNWKKVPNAKERYSGALLRHFTEYREGNTFDHETSPDPQRHIAQVACNALFLLYFEMQDEITQANNLPLPALEEGSDSDCDGCSYQHPPAYCRKSGMPLPDVDCTGRK